MVHRSNKRINCGGEKREEGRRKMKTQFVIRNSQGMYYQGLEFRWSVVDAIKFDTREEAIRRCRQRPDWKVEEFEEKYQGFGLRLMTAWMLLLVFCGVAQAQTFTQQFTSAAITSQNIVAVASGDFRSKGYADLVTANTSQICVYQNDGTGHFNVAAPNCFVFGSGLFVQGMGVGDFNGDGKLDIAAFGQGFFGGAYTFINGDGAGNFSAGGFTSNDLIPAGGGSTSGPIVGPFASAFQSNTIQHIAMSAQICSSMASASRTLVQIAGLITAEGTFPGCDNVLLGAIGYTGYLQSKGNTTGYSFVATAQGTLSTAPFTYCANASITANGYIIGYNSNGSICVEQPSGSTVATANITLTGTEIVQSILPVNIIGGQVGILALLQNGSMSLIYGADLLHLNTQVNISGPTNSVFSTDNVFRPTGVQNPGQDFAIINATGLTVFVQGTFSGAFNPTSYAFPAQAIGTSATKTFTYTNTGTGALTPLVLSVGGSPDYTITASDCPSSLPAAAFCNVAVKFLPGVVETTSSATLTAASTLVTTTAALTGSEVLFVNPVPSQTSITFSNQLVGTSSSAQTVQLFNNGNESMSASATASSNFSQTNSCTSVAAGGSCNINVIFNPSAMGSLTGSISLQTTPTSTAVNISLSGTGVQAPTITLNPASQTIVSGTPVTFTSAATGTAPLVFTWKKNSTIIGTNSNTLTFTPVASDNLAQISVQVSNIYGTATSSAATLTVLTTPVITTQPQSVSVTLGASASFSVTAQGSATLHYFWTLSGVAAGTDSPTFTTPATVASNNGAIVKVVVSNSAGSVTSANAILTVNFPSSITTQPTNQSVTLSTPTGTAVATFSLVAQGTSNSYSWIKNGSVVANTNSPSYSFTASASDNGDLIQCAVSDPFGPTVLSNTVTLTVNVPPTATAVSPTSLNVGVNQTTTFKISVTGTAPTIVWTRAGTVIASANGTSYTTPPLTSFDDRVIWTATVSSPYGTASVNFQTYVISPPVISSVTQTAAQVGQTTTLTVSATANDSAALSYQWSKGGILITGATGSTYITPVLTSADNGTLYSVAVTDVGGTTNGSITLAVTTPTVSFGLSPATQTISAGQSASYSMNILNNTNTLLTLTCSTTVPAATCNFGGNSSEILTSGVATVTVVTTTSSMLPLLWLGTFLAGLAAFTFRPRFAKYRRLVAATACASVLLVFSAGCGSAGGSTTAPKPAPAPSPSPSPSPTPTGTSYTITVTATGHNVFQSSTATLVIQ
jgi:hypothetical protein